MTKYAIKITETATRYNKQYMGGVSCTYIYGNDSVCIGMKNKYSRNATPAKADIKRYGFTRKSDAEKSSIYNNVVSDKKWVRKAEVVKFEY